MTRLRRRCGTRLLMIAGLCGLVLATLLYMGATTYAGLLLARTLQGLAAGATWTAGPAILASSTSITRRGRVLALAQTGSGIGTLLGPPLGGALFTVSPSLPFVVLIVVVGVALFAAVRLLPDAAEATGQAPPLRVMLRGGQVVLVGGVIAVGSAVLTLLEPVMPTYLAARFGIGSDAIGLLFGVALVCSAAVAVPVGALVDRIGGLRVSAIGLAAAAVVLPCIAVVSSLVGITAVFAVLGVALSFTLGPAMPSMAAAVDHAVALDGSNTAVDYVTAYALYNTAYAVGMLAGPVLGSGLVDVVGHRTALWMVAVVCGIGAVVSWRVARPR
jgi:MFS family permease